MNKSMIILLSIVLFYSCNEQADQKSIVPSITESSKVLSKNVSGSRPTAIDTSFERFNSFWQTFRQAVLSSDKVLIKSLTAFPLKYRGSSDSDPVVKISQDQFDKVFPLFLKQWSGEDLEGSTELDYIKKTVRSSGQVINGRIRIGDMIFYLNQGKWELNFIYLNNETIDSLKK